MCKPVSAFSPRLRGLGSAARQARKRVQSGDLYRNITGRLALRITRRGRFGESDLGRALKEAFRLSLVGSNDLPGWIVQMPGMSGKRYRGMINTVVRLTPMSVYMEVGSWTGSTACSALAGNVCEMICIDDWTQFGGPKGEFQANIERANTRNSSVRILETDFRRVDFSSLNSKANIYVFDGPHNENDQYDGIIMALPALQDRFLLVVDDFNLARVREGTSRALADGGLQVEASIEIRTNAFGLGPARFCEDSDWHNGYLLAIVSRATRLNSLPQT